MTKQELQDILSGLEDPRTQKKLSDITEIQSISETEGFYRLRLKINDLIAEEKKEVRKLVEKACSEKGKEVLVSIVSESSVTPPPTNNVKSMISEDILKRFKKVIAVYSTKGGVGKSTIAAGIALEASELGLKTVIVDLDIYGPSIPRILGMRGKVEIKDQKFIPSKMDNLQMMSVGLLVPSFDAPLIWRAPIVNGVLAQIFNDTIWDEEYDLLVLDMPPGTGDIPITVAQNIPINGIIAVSTPQGVALEDTVKGLAMFRKFDIPTIGFVYNMGSVICKECNKTLPLFPKNQEFDEIFMDYNIDILADLPMDPEVTALADSGQLKELSEGLWKTEFKKIMDILIKFDQ